MPSFEHTYTAQDIRDYLEGRMTHSEMHAIEKAALDDAFLADAIEGYQLDKAGASRLAIEELELKLQRKLNTPQAKIIELHPQRKQRSYRGIAAMFLAIALCTILYFALRDNKTGIGHEPMTAGSDQPAKDQKKDIPKEKKQATVEQPLLTEKTQPQNNQIAKSDKEIVPQETKLDIKPDNNIQVATTETKPTSETALNLVNSKATDVVTMNSNPDSVSIKSIAAKQSNNSLTASTQKVRMPAGNQSQTPPGAEASKMFAAQVLGPDHSPLPFAKISILKDKIGTYADAKGNFVLVSTDTLIELEVSSVGFLPKYYNLRSDGNSQIVLQEDKVALSKMTEVLTSTTAKNSASIRGRFIKDSAQNVEPADGWDLYGSYVDNNIEIPESVIDNNIKGTVEISFEVKRNGNVSNAKVDKSLCNDCDEEALRLIKQGPQWKVKKGRKAKSKVKVQF